MNMDSFLKLLEDNISWIKDIFTIIIAITVTVISILTYRKARSTILQPIRTEVIKKQSQLLSELLSIISKNNLQLANQLDYIGLAKINTYLQLRDLGFVFKDQDEIIKDIEKDGFGMIYCGDSNQLKDAEIVGIFKENKSRAENDDFNYNKYKFKEAQKGNILIDKIYTTKKYRDFNEKLVYYSRDPFLPNSIIEILSKIVSDINNNLTIHLKETLFFFLAEFCNFYFKDGTARTISGIGVYNDFNHRRIHHNIEIDRLRLEIRNYLKIDEKW